MFEISNLVLIVVVQVFLFLFMMIGLLLYLLRKRSKKIKAMQSAAEIIEEVDGQEVMSPRALVKHYLIAEIKLAETRFDMFYTEEDLFEPVYSEPDWISLRKNFLQLEMDLLEEEDRFDNFWKNLGKKTAKLLKINHLVKRLKSIKVEEDDEDDIKEMKNLLKSQYDDFDDLGRELVGAKTDDETRYLKKRLDNIIRSHTELSHCMHLLESENTFLREQIKSLVTGDERQEATIIEEEISGEKDDSVYDLDPDSDDNTEE